MTDAAGAPPSIDATSPAPPGTAQSARRPSNRRDLILGAAIHLFHERGYHATGVDDIGEAVDVSGPAIYRHFASKEDILVEAIRLAADQVHASAPHWIRETSYGEATLFPADAVLARIAEELDIPSPWVVHGGLADCLICESRARPGLRASSS